MDRYSNSGGEAKQTKGNENEKWVKRSTWGCIVPLAQVRPLSFSLLFCFISPLLFEYLALYNVTYR